MTEKKVQELDHGLYRIYWNSGGDSIASIGSNEKGERWLAPTNWIHVGLTGRKVWRMVKRVEKFHVRDSSN